LIVPATVGSLNNMNVVMIPAGIAYSGPRLHLTENMTLSGKWAECNPASQFINMKTTRDRRFLLMMTAPLLAQQAYAGDNPRDQGSAETIQAISPTFNE
jgi:hypothetical protein